MKTKRIDPHKIYIAIESFAGERFAVKTGQRLRGDHEAVKVAPHLFLEDGADDSEMAAARAGQLDFLNQPEPADPNRIRLPEPLTIASPHALVATRDARFKLEDGSLAFVRAGDLVDDRSPWVARARRQKRGGFRKPTRKDQRK